MIQDIAPKKLYNEYHPTEPSANDYIAVFYEKEILIKEDLIKDPGGRLELPKRADVEKLFRYPADGDGRQASGNKRPDMGTYLFRIEETPYFLYADECCRDGLELADTALRWAGLAEVRGYADHELCFAAYTAYHLYQWYKSHRFCGCCGARTVTDAKERMLFCPKCGSRNYPRIAPAVIAAVTNGGKILLTKYAGREYKRYALIAGFTEIGETAEDTVRREVMEETGVRVKNIRYYKSQPWGIDGNLLFGYFAELDGSDQITMDQNELSAAEWVSWEALKDMDDAFSLTREMMRVFYENHGSV